MAPRTAYLAAGVLGVSIAASGLWWMASRGERASAPPSPDLSTIDPEIAALVRASLKELKRRANDPGPWMNLGMVYDANNLKGFARPCYEQVVRLAPADPRPWYHLALVRAELGDLPGALEAVRRTIGLAPTYAPARWRRGLWLLDSGDLAAAETAFMEATRIDPADSAGWIGLGRVYLSRGADREAVEVLRRAASGTNNVAYAHQLLASAYRQLGRLEEAEAVALRSPGADKHVWRDPWLYELARLRRGQKSRIDHAYNLITQKRYGEAVPLLKQLRAERPDDIIILINLGIAYRALRRFDRSIQTFQSALALRPDHYAAHFELARAYMEKSQQPGAEMPGRLEDRAVHHVERAVALNPTYADAHLARGLFLLSRQDLSGAAESFRTAARLEPENPRHLYNAGLAYCRMSEWDEARRVLQIVTRQDPNQGHGFHLLGVAQLNLGHLEEAERALRRAKELLPSDAAVDEALRQLRRKREAARPK